MISWSFRKAGQPYVSPKWLFTIDSPHINVQVEFNGGAFRRLDEYELVEISNGVWDRTSVTLLPDNELVVNLNNCGVSEIFIKLDQASAAALRAYIENIPETDYNDNHNFNDNEDHNSLTEFEYNVQQGQAVQANAGNNANNNPGNNANNNPGVVGGSRKQRRKTHRRKNRKGTRRWRK